MAPVLSQAKRLLVGRPYANERLARERLPKRLALPVFSADNLSSLAYAPDQIIVVLAMAGTTAVTMGPWIGLAVVVIMGIILVGHVAIIAESPEGGGDFTLAHAHLGAIAGQIVGSSLLVDYVLTVAVSTSQAASYVAGAVGLDRGQHVFVAIGIILLLMVINLRGVRQATALVMIPVGLFVASVMVLILLGIAESVTGQLMPAPSASFEVAPVEQMGASLTTIGGIVLVIRAFSQGCVASSGVKTITNAVPGFRKPKVRNAMSTLIITGAVSMSLMLAVMWLAWATHVVVVEDPRTQLRVGGVPPQESFQQVPVLGQLAQAVAPSQPWFFWLITAVTVLILVTAASTAFQGFPTLASVLAVNSYVPRFFSSRGDRLAYSNGIVALMVASLLIVIATGGAVSTLIHMYLVSVFVSFALGQAGLARRYRVRMQVSPLAAERRTLSRKARFARMSAVLMGLLLIFVVVSEVSSGAWITLAVIAAGVATMGAIARHYRVFAQQLDLGEHTTDHCIPVQSPSHRALGSHAVVIVTELTRPAVAAIETAAREPHASIQAVTVRRSDDHEALVRAQWKQHRMGIPLRILYSPYRAAVAPIEEYVRSLTQTHPNDTVVVYIPEYLVGHWWHAALHNQALRRAQSQLGAIPRVNVVSVPWELNGTER